MVGNKAIIEMLDTALCRFSFMECLDDEPKDKRTLVDEVHCSRSTVNRGIRELESLDLVEYVDGGYRLSSIGKLVAADFADMAETIEIRLQFEPFLKWVPEDTFDLDLELLRDADLLLPKPGDPYAMVNRHVTVIERTYDHKFLLPLVGLHAQKATHSQVVENGAQCEMVVTPEVVDTLRSAPEYAELSEEMAATGRLHVYEFEADIPYFVGLLDDTIQIGVDEEGEPRALLETTNTEVQDWAAATFEEYKQQSEPVITPQKRPKLQT